MTCPSTLQKRPDAITMKGKALTLLGPVLTAGQKAPEFTVLRNDLTPAQLSDYAGKTIVLSVVPSLDTPVCDQQTRRFNEAAADLGDVAILTISMDLPFAQARWCGAAGVEAVETLSDHAHADFGSAYGVLIDGLRLLARAIFVIGADGALRHIEIVSELTDHPDYDAALAAARAG